MKNWELHQELYRRQGREGDQSGEDMVARRILRGMGASNAERDIHRMEQHILGEVKAEQPLWARTCRMFTTLLSQSAEHAALARRWRIQALQVKGHADALERMTIAPEYKAGREPLLCVRMGKTRTVKTYMIWEEDALHELPPPFEVAAAELMWNLRLIIMDTVQFTEWLVPCAREGGA